MNLLKAVSKPLGRFLNRHLHFYANHRSAFPLSVSFSNSSFPTPSPPSPILSGKNPPDGVSTTDVCGNCCPWLRPCCSGGFWVAVVGLRGVTGAAGWDGVCARSSGGGTGNTTGLEELDSLFISSTWIGPELLLRLIWYFFCPFCPCRGGALRKLKFL